MLTMLKLNKKGLTEVDGSSPSVVRVRYDPLTYLDGKQIRNSIEIDSLE